MATCKAMVSQISKGNVCPLLFIYSFILWKYTLALRSPSPHSALCPVKHIASGHFPPAKILPRL